MLKRGGFSALALGVAALLGAASPAAASRSEVRVGSVPRHPPRSRVIGPLSSTARIKVTVTLKPRDPAGLASYATAVSTPGSSVYHQYLTVAEFRARFGPTGSQIAAVDQSLREQGLRPGSVSANGLAIPVSSSAGTVARAFSLSFERVALANDHQGYANTVAPRLPASVASTVQAVLGLSTLNTPQPLGTSGGARRSGTAPNVVTGGPQPCTAAITAAGEWGAYTADQLASAYQFSSLYGAGDEGAGQTIALYELEPNKTSDISAYQSCYGTTTSVSYVKVDGGAGTGAGSGEAALDIEDVIGLAPKANVLVYQGPNGSGVFDTYNLIVSQDKANVISTSWGLCEPEQSSEEVDAENTLFQEAATQGQSVFAASGDLGAEACNGSNSLSVGDPASQPYVTGVGGTSLTALGPPPVESVWNGSGVGAGGGGISTLWQMPSYQSDASHSLEVVNSNSSASPCGASPGSYCREVPDVSADADPYTGYLIYYSDGWTGIGGTSAAAPLWAAFMALVNAASACNGNPVGFANPVLYEAAAGSYASDFHDITSGNNDFTGTNSGKFPAGIGYDMATGLGSPDGSTLPAALCDPVRITPPGDQTNTLGGANANLQIQAIDASSTATLTYAAAGLPAGLSIDPSTGLITGTPTTPGSSDVTVTVTDSNSAANTTSFIWTVSKRTTATSLSCAPGSLRLGHATTCTATVLDAGSGSSTPAGAVDFTSDGSGSFTNSGACTLAPNGTPGDASCHLNYTPTSTGTHHITATYTGDSTHQRSSRGFALTVPAPPAAQIFAPSDNQTFARGQSVATTFVCTEGTAGPGLASCKDSSGAGGTGATDHGKLDTATVGAHSYTVTAISNDGQTANASINYEVLSAPTNTTRPAITGAAAAGDTLACSNGSWSGSPTAYSYQWNRDGTPITGASASSYTVQTLDEGSVLTCTVAAANVAGPGPAATSPGVSVAVPHVAGCPPATGKLSGTSLALVKLGETRKRAKHAYDHSSNRGSRYQDFFCLTPIGIRVGYASPKLLTSLSAAARRHFKQRVVWISTANPLYAIDGVRPGATVTAAAASLRLGRVFHVGRNDWYLAPAGKATAVLKARGGIVEEIGIATKQLTRTRAAQRTFLTSFS